MPNLTRNETSDLLGLTYQAISLLAKQPGCPTIEKNGRKYFVFPQFFRWYLTRKLEEKKAKLRPTLFTQGQARREMAKAQQEELRLAQMRRKLMSVEEWERTVADAYGRVRSHLLALPHRLAPELTGCRTSQEAHARIVPLVDEVLAELHKGEDVPDEEHVAA